ncbi:outer membrane protein assembly factor BamB [Halochromatium salexigens]|uniref:Outer membrane protein assembly factor BamB n=1 Tax=Halochromatium salexigens TaxID=49447 RepID=A0AAJ0XGM1_HALSE|nr:outer membrane protein assembly factor BamB [Halochromatium salexigens]MBK5931231.1 outer membrane protein assembly factor BamB [Halochromatium salexigens]
MNSHRPLCTRRRALLLALGGSVLLQGCGSLGWIGLGRNKPPRPPTELAKTAPQAVQIRPLWSTRIGKGQEGRTLSLRPAVAGNRVYAADHSGRVVALAAADGRPLWERDERRMPFSGGPDVDGEQLVVGASNGQVLLLSTRDGSQRWRAQLGSEVLSVPRIIGDLVVVHTIDDSVYALELSDGSERWRFGYQAPILTLRGSSTPAVGPNGIIVGVSKGRLIYLDPEQGVPIWEVMISPPSGRTELERIADIDTDPVVVGEQVFVASFNGDLAAVDINSGTVRWRRELSAHAGLAASADALYITDSDDQLWAADPTDGAGRWRQDDLRYRRLTAPVVVGDALVVGDLEGYVHWVSPRDGRLLGRTRVGKAAVASTPVVAGQTLYVQLANGTIAAVRATGTPTGARSETPPAAETAASARQD